MSGKDVRSRLAAAVSVVGIATVGLVTGAGAATAAAKSADLSIALPGPSSAPDGGSFSETITVTNHGPNGSGQVASGVSIPDGTTVTSAPGGFTNNKYPGYEYFDDPALASGMHLTHTVTYKVHRHVHRDATITAVTASGSGVSDPNESNNQTSTKVKLG